MVFNLRPFEKYLLKSDGCPEMCVHILEHYGYGYIIMHQLWQGCLAVLSLLVCPFVNYIYVWIFLAHITAEKSYSVKTIVQDPQIPDSRYFLSSQIPDFLGFNSQIPNFLGLYSLIPDADSPPPPLININPGNYSRCRNACLISQSEVIAYKVGACLFVCLWVGVRVRVRCHEELMHFWHNEVAFNVMAYLLM